MKVENSRYEITQSHKIPKIREFGLISLYLVAKTSPRGSLIGCEPHIMKRMSQVQIPLPLPLCGHVKKKIVTKTIQNKFNIKIMKCRE
jgi:hypothetical protein